MDSYRSYQRFRSELMSGEVTCLAAVEHFLGRIEDNQNLNAFLEVFEESAKQRAEQIDLKVQNGSAGRLAGMVIGLKDNICYAGHKVSASSKILEGFESKYSSTVVERLLAEDVIIIGRLNCDEFAMGASNENSAYGPVLNGADHNRVPGGSSGGAAVAVQEGMCMASFGSDTGGSIRQPASFCGVVGVKPTYGRVSRYGLLAYASSFDQIGPLTNNLEDAALLMEIISGADEKDATSSRHDVASYAEQYSLKENLKVAYITDCLEHEGLDEEVKAGFQSTVDKLKQAGHSVEGVSFPYLDYMVPCYYVLTTAEASSNLSRYSGLMYGHRSKEAVDLESTFKKSRSEGFGEEVQRRIMLGTFVLSSDYYDAYYTKAQQVRQVIREKTRAIFEDFDFVLLPTTSTPAFKLGEKAENPIAMYLADLFTVQANLAGNPAISLPLYKTKENLPFGLQVMANDFEEHALLEFCKYLDRL